MWIAIRSAMILFATWASLNKDKIQAIVLRVQKDTKDGWTNEEKEQLAIDIFFQGVYVKIPWFLKFVSKEIMERQIRLVIRAICAEAKKLKGLIKKMFKYK